MKYVDRKERTTGALAIMLITAVLAPGSVLAQGNGGSPKGKPFIEIQGQFVEVHAEIDDMQEHIDDLVGAVDSLEDRVGANTAAIAGLEAKNVILDQQIVDLVATTAANSADIAAAMDLIDDLEADLVLLRADAEANAEAIALTEAEIVMQRDYITQNTQGLQSLLQQVQNNIQTIAALQADLATIEADLAKKQDILTGTCAPGTALVAIDPNGSITCQVAGGATGTAQFTVTQVGEIPAGTLIFAERCFTLPDRVFCVTLPTTDPGVGTVAATCPTGTVLAGGGYDNPFNLNVASSQASLEAVPGALSWAIEAENYSRSSPMTIYATANCLRFD